MFADSIYESYADTNKRTTKVIIFFPVIGIKNMHSGEWIKKWMPTGKHRDYTVYSLI